MSSGPFIVILDLDETLLTCRPTDPTVVFPNSSSDTFSLKDGTCIVVRPGFHKFLKFILVYFDEICIFTAATLDYAQEIIDILFKGVKLGGVWTRTDCHIDETSVAKDLTRIRSPTCRTIDSQRTFIVDDRGDVSARNIHARDNNHYIIPPFLGDPNDREFEKVMRTILAWKAGLLGCGFC